MAPNPTSGSHPSLRGATMTGPEPVGTQQPETLARINSQLAAREALYKQHYVRTWWDLPVTVRADHAALRAVSLAGVPSL
jgi:hypothetical protein